MINNSTLLGSSYLPSIQYITKFITSKEIIIEIHDNYQKQTYRNRCHIYSPNGMQVLSIPIKKNHGSKTKLKDVEISYAEKWHLNHIKAIEAAYRSSPFYEYYINDLVDILMKEHKFLIHLNHELLTFILDSFELEKTISFSDSYIHNNDIYEDYRELFHPKKEATKTKITFKPQKYYQVFQEKFDFISNLSSIDLLFNEGPNSQEILRSSVF
jgi:WbqC-like protein family